MLASGSLLAAADPAAVAPLISAGIAAGIPVTPIGVVTAQSGRLTIRAGSTDRELPVYVSDEVTRVL